MAHPNPELAKQRAARIAEWFKDHRAEYAVAEVGGVTIERLKWRKPGTRNCAVDYVCIGGTVLVATGDLGDAIYNSGAARLSWWAGCHLDYFAGKCIASEVGRGYEEWDRRQADHELRGWLGDAELEPYEREHRHEIWQNYGSAEALGSQEGWREFLADHGREFFGDEWWEYSSPGMVIAQRCEAHLVGLRFAVGQLPEIAATELQAVAR